MTTSVMVRIPVTYKNLLMVWRENAIAAQNLHLYRLIGSSNSTRMAATMRNNLSEYFSANVGRVDWQDAAVDRGYYM